PSRPKSATPSQARSGLPSPPFGLRTFLAPWVRSRDDRPVPRTPPVFDGKGDKRARSVARTSRRTVSPKRVLSVSRRLTEPAFLGRHLKSGGNRSGIPSLISYR